MTNYYFGKGVAVALFLENAFLFMTNMIISTKEGYKAFGTMPIWILILTSTLVAFYFLAEKKSKKGDKR